MTKAWRVFMVLGVVACLILLFQIKSNWDSDRFMQSAGKMYDGSR